MNLVPGKIYRINHSRKGQFLGRVLKQIGQEDDQWVTVEIVEGIADALLDYNVKTVGETVPIRMSLAEFELVEDKS